MKGLDMTTTFNQLTDELIKAIASPDHSAVRMLVTGDTIAKVLTPGKLFEATGADSIVAMFDTLYGTETSHFDDVTVETGIVADRPSVSFRIRGRDQGRPYVFEQHGYYEANEGKIVWLNLVCSGNRTAV
jgi:hypothetical protein